MTNRFDDDLRNAARPLAREPLPDHVLDERFSQFQVPRSALRRGLLTAAAGVALVLAVVVGIGQAQAPSTGDPSSLATPSSSVHDGPLPASSSGPTLSPVAVLGCEDSGGLEPADGEMLVYFTCEPPPAEPRAVIRGAAETTAPEDQIRAALEAMLVGPTSAERDLGFSSVFGQDAEALLTGVEWQLDGLAIVDFSADLQSLGALNSAHNAFLLFGTLERTLFQFDAVTAVEYRLEGSCEAFATYFQGTCGQTVKTAGQSSINGCPALAPSELPSGAPATAARDNIQSPGQQVSWGSGADTVTQRVEMDQGPFELPPAAEPIVVRGQPGFVNAIDEEPDALIQMGWNEGNCAYMVWLGPGITLEEAIDYAGRYLKPASETECENAALGYRVTYPADWFVHPADIEEGIAACALFGPEPFAASPSRGTGQGASVYLIGGEGSCLEFDGGARPDGLEAVEVADLPAYRIEVGPDNFLPQSHLYAINLAPDAGDVLRGDENGSCDGVRALYLRTDAEGPGDYPTNMRVVDRIAATLVVETE